MTTALTHRRSGGNLKRDGTIGYVNVKKKTPTREQGWHSGERAHFLPMCPGFDSQTQRHKWAELVGSLLWSERFFSGYSSFLLSPKTNI